MLLALLLQVAIEPPQPTGRGVLQGVVVGEVTSTSALLQARMTAGEPAADGSIPGRTGGMFFELYPVDDPPGECEAGEERVVESVPANWDHIARVRYDGLRPDTEYRWELLYQVGPMTFAGGGTGTFRTLPGAELRRPVSFVVANCMNMHYFRHGGQGRPAYAGEDKDEGFPGLAAIRAREPDFVVFAGDNVYYDRPRDDPATDRASMRAHWHALFAQPRMQALLAEVPSYWLKDDHDHRFNDSDRTGDRPPSHELGRAVFREQVPIVELDDDETPTWRKLRVSRDLEIWMTEGRDHRSPNAMEDGPDKTLWGVEQRAWLKRTLLASDATFKILISPTPLVGPDDAYKADNHTNPKGFRQEGEAFHAWLAEQGLNDQGFLVICGDRHWQYHSVHPQGTHEFAVGALIDANARMGRRPGDPKSTDPDAEVRQPYTSPEPSGGFLEVRLEVDPEPRLDLILRDEIGRERHQTQRAADAP